MSFFVLFVPLWLTLTRVFTALNAIAKGCDAGGFL
jgi:hypothetical protein